MAGMYGKGMGAGGMGGMGAGEDLFGSASAAPSEDMDFSSLFSEEEDMGEGGDPLMSALEGAGYSVTPEKLEQIKQILGEKGAEGGMGPAGMTPTDSGPEAMRSAP